MERLEVECFSREANAAVVRLPWRKHPGLVVQGDSLKTLLALVEEARSLRAAGSIEDANAAAEDLERTLLSYVSEYERVLAAHGMPLPYVGVFGNSVAPIKGG